MPQPQKITECLSIINDSTLPLDKIYTKVIQLINTSDLFNLLNSLIIILEAQILNQTQTLILCYILSKQYPPTQNPFFPTLKKQYLKSEEFEKQFISILLTDTTSIQSKSISQIIGENSLQQINIDINKLTEEYEQHLPINIPSISAVFSDPDESGNKEKDLQKLFEHQIPPAIIPPQNHPAPLLMMPGNDELVFLLPEINFSPFFLPSQISIENYQLIEKAEREKLSAEEKAVLIEKIQTDDIVRYFTPSKLSIIYQYNKELLDEIIAKVLKTEYENEFLHAFNQLPMSIELVKIAHSFVSSSPNSFTGFVENVIKYCFANKSTVKSFIEKIVGFLEVYVTFLLKKGGVVTPKLKAFCDEFVTIKEVNKLKSLLK